MKILPFFRQALSPLAFLIFCSLFHLLLLQTRAGASMRQFSTRLIKPVIGELKVFILIAVISILPAALRAQEIHWPGNRKAAIVLTYDDALPSQLVNAVPELRRNGLKATFFLTSDIDSISVPEWRKLAKQGFELGNHTVFHPCAGTDDNPVPSEHYTVYQVIREIEVMDRFLFAVDGNTQRTFAYPCAETFVGGKDYADSLQKYTLVKYARAGGDSSAVITDFVHLDRFRIPSYGLDGGESGSRLIAFVKNVEQRGGLGIIMFHGIGGDYITVSAESHRELLHYLHSRRKQIWVTTFQQAMDEAYRQVKMPPAGRRLTATNTR